MTLKKAFIIVVLILIRPFIEFLNLRGNSMYVLPDNGQKTETLTYSASIDSITRLDPSLMQLSILDKIY